MPKIRTTIRPLEEIDVPREELRHLRGQRLVLEGTRAKTEQGLVKAAARLAAAEPAPEPEPAAKAPAKRATKKTSPPRKAAANTSNPGEASQPGPTAPEAQNEEH